MTKSLILGHLGFGGHLEFLNDANLASSRFQIRIPIPTYFGRNIFSLPEHEVLWVSYCDRSSSVIRPCVHLSILPAIMINFDL